MSDSDAAEQLARLATALQDQLDQMQEAIYGLGYRIDALDGRADAAIVQG